MILQLWTDGSGIATGGPGGWAFILRAIDAHGEVARQREASGPLSWATNQRAELQAVMEGLRALSRSTAVQVFSDSEYVLDGFRKDWVDRWQENGWINREGDDVKNRDLWEALAAQVARHEVTWHHVKGHMKTWSCPSCGWSGDEPDRDSPRARIRFCPPCRQEGRDVRVEARDKYPLNARCDELAGAQRRAVLEGGTNGTHPGGAAGGRVGGGGAAAANGHQPVQGAEGAPARDRARQAAEGVAGSAPSASSVADDRRPTCGPAQHAALAEHLRVTADRRSRHPTNLDPKVLTEALRIVGQGYAAYRREHGSGAVPTTLSADRMTWSVCDSLALACYGVKFSVVVGREWWPAAKPPKEPHRAIDASLGPQEFAVA